MAAEKKKPVKVEDNTVKPTKPLSAYIFFSTQEVPKIVKEQQIPHKDAMKVAGANWGKLTEEEKAPFLKKHEDDKLR